MLNRAPALMRWVKGGNVTSAEWPYITLCDLIWHVRSQGGEAVANCNTTTTFSLLTSLDCWMKAEKYFSDVMTSLVVAYV